MKIDTSQLMSNRSQSQDNLLGNSSNIKSSERQNEVIY